MTRLSKTNDSRIDVVVETSGVTHILEFKRRVQAVRTLHSSLIQIASLVARQENAFGYLVLIDPDVTDKRLADEWDAARPALNDAVSRRLSIIVYRHNEFQRIVGPLPAEVEAAIRGNLPLEVLEQPGMLLPRPNYLFEILKVLLVRRFHNEPAISTKALTGVVGCSYPTAAKALERLAPYISRHEKKSLKLTRFPRKVWTELLASSQHLRATRRFVDRSGQPRSFADLAKRLDRVADASIGMGGVVATRYWYPGLDLEGIPRLDVCVHCPDLRLDVSFVRKLDPGLKELEDPLTPANVVVHAVQRNLSLFEKASRRASWADPVECLLDLYEMRLEAQAVDFVRWLEGRRSADA